jgi:uncharacterized cupredoxin-like copper-binding protein
MKTTVLASALALVVSIFVSSATAATVESVLNVQLQDSGTVGGGAMRIVLDHDSVKAGRVTLRAVNQSHGLIHEVIVVRVAGEETELPYNEKQATVIENRITRLGEISDLKPGASGTLVLKLKPGSYLLICNQPGHYKAGMQAHLSVTSK